MTHFIHIFKKQANIPKPNYTVEMRKAFAKWPKSIMSEIGQIIDDRILLPECYIDTIDSKQTGAIIIQDTIDFNEKQPELKIISFNENDKIKKQNSNLLTFGNQNSVWIFELFAIEKTALGKLELHLKYENNKYSIGEPKRNDQKLFELEKGKPIEVKINGKSDTTMSAGKQRNYSEFDYIIEYLGEVNSISFEAPNRIRVERIIPQVIEKTIDLRKILY